MLKDYLSIGGIEVVNSARAKGYAETAGCPLSWQKCDCEGLYDATGPGNFDIASIANAPWFDLRNPESARFYGVTGLGLRDIASSTLERDITEGITDGGVAGSPRFAGKSVRVRAFLSAEGEDALEYGMAWLKSALASQQCVQHDAACGGAEVKFFVSYPPERAFVSDGAGGTRPETDAEYLPKVDSVTRFLHGASTVSGPLEVQTYESRDGRHWGREVEFTIYAERPGIYGVPRSFGVLSSPGSVVDDVVRNLIPFPSAELPDPDFEQVAMNYITNPSLEVNGNNWRGNLIFGSDDPSPAVGSLTAAVVAGDRAGVGRSAFRTRWVGNGATAGSGTRGLGIFMTQQLSGLPSGSYVVVTVWVALIAAQGAALANGETVSASYVWLDSSGGTVGLETSLGTASGADRSGKTLSLSAQAVPSGATGIEIRVASASLIARSDPNPALNRDLRMYADAAGVIREM